MSKNFEEEYKEYLNAQAPDLWSRIEDGVDALGAKPPVIESIEPKQRRGRKKKQIRYQHYRMLVSVAACLFAMVIIVPVYLLTRPVGKDSAPTEAAPQMLEDVTIQNIVADSDEMADAAMEESEPAVESAGGVTEVDIQLEESAEDDLQMAQVTTENTGSDAIEEEGITSETEGADGGQLAAHDTDGTTEGAETMLETTQQEDEVAPQEELKVTILGEGSVSEAGVMFAAAVIGSASSETITLFVPVGSDVVLEPEKDYTLTVQQSQDGSSYVVVKAAVME